MSFPNDNTHEFVRYVNVELLEPAFFVVLSTLRIRTNT